MLKLRDLHHNICGKNSSVFRKLYTVYSLTIYRFSENVNHKSGQEYYILQMQEHDQAIVAVLDTQ